MGFYEVLAVPESLKMCNEQMVTFGISFAGHKMLRRSFRGMLAKGVPFTLAACGTLHDPSIPEHWREALADDETREQLAEELPPDRLDGPFLLDDL